MSFRKYSFLEAIERRVMQQGVKERKLFPYL